MAFSGTMYPMSKIVVPLIFILAGVGLIIFFIVPGWQQFLTIRADNKHLQEIDDEVNALTGKRDEIVAKISRISKDDLKRVDQAVPTGPQGPEFLIMIQRYALSHGLTVKKLDLSGTLSTKSKTPEPKISGVARQPALLPVESATGQGAVMPGGPPSGVGKSAEFTPSGQQKQKTQEAVSQSISASVEVEGSYEAVKGFLRDVELSPRITDIETIGFLPTQAGYDVTLTLKTYYQ